MGFDFARLHDEDRASARGVNRFIAELNRAINIVLDGDHLTLRLDSHLGVMHFRTEKPSAENQAPAGQ